MNRVITHDSEFNVNEISIISKDLFIPDSVKNLKNRINSKQKSKKKNLFSQIEL